MEHSKGISPLIASVLLIAFTLSIAMLAGPFFQNTLKDVQSGTTEKTEKLVKSTNLGLDIEQIRYNRSTANLSITLRNTGSSKIENISVTVLGDRVYHRESSRKIPRKQIETFEIKAGDYWDLESVKVDLNKYPVSTEKGLDGKAAEEKLVGYWTMDEGSGTYANDTSGKGNNATLMNGSTVCSGNLCPNWGSGKFEGSVRLDSSNDYLQVPDSKSLDVDKITMAAWVYTSGSSTGNIIFNKEGTYEMAAGTNGISLAIDAEECSGWCNGWMATDVGSIPSSTWTHVTTTWDGDVGKFYINGELLRTVDPSEGDGDIVNSGRDLGIGARNVDSDPRAFFDGRIDEARVWDTALSSEELETLVRIDK